MTRLRPSRRHDLRHNPQDAARLRLRSLPRRRIPLPRTTGSSRSRRPTLSSSWSKGWMTKAYLTAPRPVETHDGGGGIIPTCRPVGVPWEVHPCASPRCARPSGESPASSSRPSNPWEDELRFMDRWFSDLPVGPGRTWRREDLYDRRPRLPLGSERARPDGRDPIQLHAVHIQSTFSHFQSTFSHMWIHIQSTWGSTYVDPHARRHRGIYGVQRRMVETI
jgi:hypothetical protein